MPAKPIPDGYSSAIPYLIIRGAAAAMEFYQRAFGAVEVLRYDAPNGQIGHAEMKIGEALFMLADEYPEMDFRGPKTMGGTPVSIMVYVPDVDALARQAVSAGAKLQREVQDQFYGDRSCSIEDPFGHSWHFATHKEDLTPEEMHRRAEAAATKGNKK